MKTKLPLLVGLVLFFVSCKQVTMHEERQLPSHQGSIRITGAYALYPMMTIWISEFQKTHPDVKFDLTAIGSGRGLKEIVDGKTDLAMISSEIPVGSNLDSILWIIPVARLGVVPVISQKNPYLDVIRKKGMKRDDMMDIFSGENPKTWGDMFGQPHKDPVRTYLRSDSSGATDILAVYLWMKTSDIKGMPVDGETRMVEAIRKDPLALGYCNFIYTFDPGTMRFVDGIVVTPIDFNMNGRIDAKEAYFDSVSRLQRAMWLGKFPCSLMRNLYLASKGKPGSEEIVEFLSWVVTEGQKFVPAEGYVELHTSEIQYVVTALKY